MVEFRLGRNIKAKHDKLLIAATGADLAQMLNEDEKVIVAAVQMQTPKDGIKAYDLGKYTAFVDCANNKIPAEWLQAGGVAYQKIKQCRQVKVQIVGATAQNLADWVLGVELAAYRFDKYVPPASADLFPSLESVIFTDSGLKNLEACKPNIAVATAVRYARDLLNEPENVLTPAEMAADLKRLKYLGLEVEIPAGQMAFAVLKWRGKSDTSATDLGLVGGAEVAALMKAIALQKAAKNVTAVVGLDRSVAVSEEYLHFLQEHFRPRYLAEVSSSGKVADKAVMAANDAKWAQIITAAGEKTGEKVRQVSCMAVPEKLFTPWVQIDIAGVAVADGRDVLYPAGVSGFGVRLLAEAVHKI